MTVIQSTESSNRVEGVVAPRERAEMLDTRLDEVLT
jgi:hypothetical protein